MTLQEAIRENGRRHELLNAPYDPIVGIGSPLERFPLALDKKSRLFLPLAMQGAPRVREILKAGSLSKWAKNHNTEYTTALSALNRVRVGYDFEFWSASCVKVVPKIPLDDGSGLVNFALNLPQRKYLLELEKQRLANVPIRMIVLKHRQWGATTMTQIYLGWIQLYRRRHWNSMIVSDVKAKSAHVRAMYETMIDYHPQGFVPGVDTLSLSRYQGQQDYRIVNGRGNIIGVSSVENPDASRSYTLHLLHLSEVGFWKSTPSVNASALAQSLEGSLVVAPDTVCVKESTAFGVGTYFHGEWQRAEKGESNDVPLFVAWYEDPQYTMPVQNVEQFWNSLNEYERFLWAKGATLEHICWYRWKARNFDQKYRMQAEFPTTAQEAFQSTGQRVFEPERVQLARQTCTVPLAIGNLAADATKGKKAFTGITFTKDERGPLRIWTFPGKAGIEKPGKRYTNRYCAFADTGGRSEGSDNSTVKILDRIWTIFGGVPVVAAEFQKVMDQDLFAWYAARLCAWYENALLAVEVNKLYDSERGHLEGAEPEHSFTVLDEIKDFYANLYYRVRPETIQERWDGVLGFHTNRETKPMIINALNAALREQSYEEKSLWSCDEFDTYEFKPGGRAMGATEKKKDDLVIATAGAVWLSGQMPPVKEVDIVQENRSKKVKGGFAQFS